MLSIYPNVKTRCVYCSYQHAGRARPAVPEAKPQGNISRNAYAWEWKLPPDFRFLAQSCESEREKASGIEAGKTLSVGWTSPLSLTLAIDTLSNGCAKRGPCKRQIASASETMIGTISNFIQTANGATTRGLHIRRGT